MICYLHCTLRDKDELRVSPSVFDAAQAYEPLLSLSNIVRCKVSVFSPVILIPCETNTMQEGKKCLMFRDKIELYENNFLLSETKVMRVLQAFMRYHVICLPFFLIACV